MAWVNIPNEPILDFTGRPLRAQCVNDDLEAVFKPIRCPDCAASFTVARLFNDHVQDEHGLDPETTTVTVRPEQENLTAAGAILQLITHCNSQARDNPLASIRRPNDAYHATEAWRRAWPAHRGNDPVLRLRQEQYEWLHGLLDRKLPLTKEARERQEEQQTVAMHLWSLAEDNVRQALRTLPERRRREPDPDAPVDAPVTGAPEPSGRVASEA